MQITTFTKALLAKALDWRSTSVDSPNRVNPANHKTAPGEPRKTRIWFDRYVPEKTDRGKTVYKAVKGTKKKPTNFYCEVAEDCEDLGCELVAHLIVVSDYYGQYLVFNSEDLEPDETALIKRYQGERYFANMVEKQLNPLLKKLESQMFKGLPPEQVKAMAEDVLSRVHASTQKMQNITTRPDVPEVETPEQKQERLLAGVFARMES